MSKSKGRASNVLLIVLLLAGLSLLLYPTVSNLWNSFHQSRAIVDYSEEVSDLNVEQSERLLAEAERYNQELLHDDGRFEMTGEQRDEYESELRVSDTGMMGYLEIPCLDVSMPIYHGTDEAVLQVGAGHLEGSSLPVGGKGTHCVLSGHRGLPSSKLFSDLDKMEVGDIFVITVLDRTITYEVDQILTVEPEDMEPLGIDAQQDFCTLVTCTPYGINTHRLLVRGHRVPNREADGASVASRVDYAPVVAGAGVALVLAGIALRAIARRKN